MIESRLEDACTVESVIEDNKRVLELARQHKVNYILIEDQYDVRVEIERKN